MLRELARRMITARSTIEGLVIDPDVGIATARSRILSWETPLTQQGVPAGASSVVTETEDARESLIAATASSAVCCPVYARKTCC